MMRFGKGEFCFIW